MQIEEEVISPQGSFVFPSDDLHQMVYFPCLWDHTRIESIFIFRARKCIAFYTGKDMDSIDAYKQDFPSGSFRNKSNGH